MRCPPSPPPAKLRSSNWKRNRPTSSPDGTGGAGSGSAASAADDGAGGVGGQLSETAEPLISEWLATARTTQCRESPARPGTKTRAIGGKTAAAVRPGPADRAIQTSLDRWYEEARALLDLPVRDVHAPPTLAGTARLELLAGHGAIAAGTIDAALQEWLQQHPAPINLDPTTQAERQDQQEREVRRALSVRLSGAMNQFAQLFGGAAGQVQTEFHATADQALFLANGGTLLNLLAPREQQSCGAADVDPRSAADGRRIVSVGAVATSRGGRGRDGT